MVLLRLHTLTGDRLTLEAIRDHESISYPKTPIASQRCLARRTKEFTSLSHRLAVEHKE
jgi:hypothetical protein